MANKDDFTPDEWTKVLESIVAAGVAIAASDPSGWLGTFKEATAGIPSHNEVKANPELNALIRSVITDFERSDDASILAMRERFTDGAPSENIKRSLQSLHEVSAIIDKNAPDDAAAFKNWLFDISQKVAEAAIEGSILGIGGVRVSDAERKTLGDISKALGITS